MLTKLSHRQRLATILMSLFLLVGLAWILIKAVDLLGYEGQLVNQDITAVSDQFELKSNVTIGQTFVAPQDGLHRIDVVLRTFGRRNTHDVTFYLKEFLESPDIIYQETFNASEIWENQWRTFQFSPIPDSAGKTYFFYFASPTSVGGDAITVGGAEGDFYNQGSAYLGQIEAPADLAFRTYYGLSFNQKLSILQERIVQDKPSIWGDIRFYILLLILYVLLLIRMFVEIVKLAQRE